jgi:hypothetical protein
MIALCAAKGSFENIQVKIQTTLDTHDARQEIVILAKALEGSNKYRLAIPTDSSEFLSLLQVYQETNELEVQRAETVKDSIFYDVKLPQTVKAGDEVKLTAKYVWIKVASPFPKVLHQLDPNQMYDYYGNVHFYSPYPTAEQAHIVKYLMVN